MPRPGYKSTEFWSTAVFQTLALMAGFIGEDPPIDEQTAMILVGAATAVYTFARSFVKFFAGGNNR